MPFLDVNEGGALILSHVCMETVKSELVVGIFTSMLTHGGPCVSTRQMLTHGGPCVSDVPRRDRQWRLVKFGDQRERSVAAIWLLTARDGRHRQKGLVASSASG